MREAIQVLMHLPYAVIDYGITMDRLGRLVDYSESHNADPDKEVEESDAGAGSRTVKLNYSKLRCSDERTERKNSAAERLALKKALRDSCQEATELQAQTFGSKLAFKPRDIAHFLYLAMAVLTGRGSLWEREQVALRTKIVRRDWSATGQIDQDGVIQFNVAYRDLYHVNMAEIVVKNLLPHAPPKQAVSADAAHAQTKSDQAKTAAAEESKRCQTTALPEEGLLEDTPEDSGSEIPLERAEATRDWDALQSASLLEAHPLEALSRLDVRGIFVEEGTALSKWLLDEE